ncbi:GNAT family N-acetyltransferase [Enterococcus sp. AZ101]|uniref:GNAT family N-acetyltransferase n=1 Tax=Enterococcus sp. AZ101 TaxID=2774742 RepID=UPI003D2CB826
MIKKIDHLTVSELETILGIWLTANCEAHPFIPKSYWQKNLSSVKEQLPQADLYTYSESDQISAFLGMTGTYIAGIFVKNDYRGQGIGSKLLTEAKCSTTSLSLCVYAKNKQALHFYQRQGFQKVHEQFDSTGELEYQLVWEK